jgi:hypothetical protein
MNDHEEKDIGAIGNYYGGIKVKVEGGKAYWGIENHDGTHWQEIPESLYNELINFNALGADYHDF